MKEVKMSRFDTRLPKDQKEYFEHAAQLGGYKTLTDFILHALTAYAEKIMEKHNITIATNKDREVFFDAIMNPPQPNLKLRKAAKRYDEQTTGK